MLVLLVQVQVRLAPRPLELVLVQPGQSERQVMWRHAEDEKLMAAFEGS